MALIYCEECASKISDEAEFCPNCGYPIQKIKDAYIEKQNRKYYKRLNKERLMYNVFAFIISASAGYWGFNSEFQTWAIIVAALCVGIMLFMGKKWVTWFMALSIVSQKYKYIPKWMVAITASFGFLIGAIVGLSL